MVSTIEFLKTILDSCSEEKVSALGETFGRELPEKIIAFRSLPVNLETVVESYAIYINQGGYGEAETRKEGMNKAYIPFMNSLQNANLFANLEPRRSRFCDVYNGVDWNYGRY